MLPKKIKQPYNIIYTIGCIFGLFISGISVLFIVSSFRTTGSYESFPIVMAIFGIGIIISSLVGLINKRIIGSFIFFISVLMIALYMGWTANNTIMSIYLYALSFALFVFILFVGHTQLKKYIYN
jgi:hypothetical protein